MRHFYDMTDAFDYCREVNKPVAVIVDGDGQYKLFPSGRAELIAKCQCGSLDNRTLCPSCGSPEFVKPGNPDWGRI